MQPGEKVFVAGHRGLVGSAIVRRLRRLGFRNLVILTRAQLDLCDGIATRAFFESEQPSYVFFAAAKVGGILANDTSPADFIRENLAIQLYSRRRTWRRSPSCSSSEARASILNSRRSPFARRRSSAEHSSPRTRHMRSRRSRGSSHVGATIASIGEVAQMIREIVGYSSSVMFDPSKPDGTPRKLLDSSPLHETGWRPTLSLHEGITRTHAWYLEHLTDARQ